MACLGQQGDGILDVVQETWVGSTGSLDQLGQKKRIAVSKDFAHVKPHGGMEKKVFINVMWGQDPRKLELSTVWGAFGHVAQAIKKEQSAAQH